jgi:hypothetical protein
VLLPGGAVEDAPAAAGTGLDDVNAWPEISSPLEQGAVQAAGAGAGGAEVSSAAAELAREMAADHALHAPAAQGSEKAAADPLGAIDEDDARRLMEAEGELEKELAELVKQAPEPAAAEEAAGGAEAEKAQAAVGAAVPGQAAAAGVTATADAAEQVAAAPMEIPVPVVILQPDEEEEEEEPAAPGVLGRVWSVVSEVALMGAQLIDLPFSWIRGLDKHIIGVAAVIFFLSGCLLMLLGWWLGGR